MDDIFSRLLSLTSCITRRVIEFIEDIVLRDVIRLLRDSEINSSCKQLTSGTWTGKKYSTLEDASSSRDCNSSSSLGFLERDTLRLEDLSFINSGSEIVNRNYSRGVHFIFKGLMLPVLFFEFAWKSAIVTWRCIGDHKRCIHAHVQSFVSRVLRTLHGSSDDIGWLQGAPGMAPTEDGSARFLELLQGIRNGVHKLPDSFVYLLIPGLFSNHGPLYFVSTKRFFSKMGLACHIAKIHSEASVEHNAWELKQYIEELYWGSGKRVMLLGHSKGGVDAAAALSIYSQELSHKVAGLALVQSPYGGTPIASDILREGQVADKETRRIMEFLICKLIKGDIRALEDLTYEKRKEFIRNHKLPDNIPLISFHSEASVAPGVIATMSHIAHAELPWLPRILNEDVDDAVFAARKVPVIVPVSAAMALTALHLQLRYGEKSDGLVTCRDAEVPGSVVVKPDKKFDHSWMVYSSWKKEPTEPDACEMCEALLTMLVELGKKG
ncbi:alpha/beta-Hydrolases superfamily protein [Perilla frutescens var. frutescens]|nr:alpha/beta-Hydrolases superfamily protein [Perilla frutescens var. frutescens]